MKFMSAMSLPLESGMGYVNSLAPGSCSSHFKSLIFKFFQTEYSLNSHCEIALSRMPWNLTDDRSTLVLVMAWCRQATSHYLNQCWPRSGSPYGITKPQWVNCALVTSHVLARMSSHRASQNSLTFPWTFSVFPWPQIILPMFCFANVALLSLQDTLVNKMRNQSSGLATRRHHQSDWKPSIGWCRKFQRIVGFENIQNRMPFFTPHLVPHTHKKYFSHNFIRIWVSLTYINIPSF